MKQIIPSVFALALFAGCTSWAGCVYVQRECDNPCYRSLKKTPCCYDSFREPYRISYPRLCPPVGETVEIGNTPSALALRQTSILRQREMLRFERGLLAAAPPLMQPASSGVTVYGTTEGAGVLEDACAPIPPAPVSPGPRVVPIEKRRFTAAPVGEYSTPLAVPVPGSPGVVYSPFRRTKYVDVKGLPPGSFAKDPYCGRAFRVP